VAQKRNHGHGLSDNKRLALKLSMAWWMLHRAGWRTADTGLVQKRHSPFRLC